MLFRVQVEMIDNRQVDFIGSATLTSAEVQEKAKQAAIAEFGEYDVVEVDYIERLPEN